MGQLSSRAAHHVDADIGGSRQGSNVCVRPFTSARRELLWLLGLLGLSVLAESFGHIPIYGVPAASAPIVASFPVCLEAHCPQPSPCRSR